MMDFFPNKKSGLKELKKITNIDIHNLALCNHL